MKPSDLQCKIFHTVLCILAVVWTAVPALAGCNVWTTNGPWGGSVTAVAVDPQDSSIVYAGTWGGGVYMSTDGGGSWREANEGLPDSGNASARSIRSIAVAPALPSTVFAGTGGGLFRSRNGGALWGKCENGLPEYLDVFTVAIDPQCNTTVFIGTNHGLFKSNDGGTTWSLPLGGIPCALTIICDPITTSTLYAGCIYVYKSMDGGASWTESSDGLPYGKMIQDLAVAPSDPSILYASFEGDGVYRSGDGAATWVPAGQGLGEEGIPALAVDPEDPDIVFAGSYSGVLLTTDGGISWTVAEMGIQGLGVSALSLDPQAPSTIYAGAWDAGLFKSSDRGVIWKRASAGISRLVISDVAVAPPPAGTLYAGSKGGGLFRSADGGESWEPISDGLPTANVETVIVDPRDPSILYVQLYTCCTYKSVDAGLTWYTSHQGVPGPNSLLVMDPGDSKTLYTIGRDSLYRTEDGGATWATLQSDLPIIEGVNALVVHPSNPGILYAGIQYGNPYDPYAPPGGVYKSEDGGTMWRRSNEGITYGEPVLSLAVDPADPRTLYAGTYEGWNLYGGGIYKSTDGGDSWAVLRTGLPQPESSEVTIHDIAVDPIRPTTLYAGGYFGPGEGVYTSTDGGMSWAPANNGMLGLGYGLYSLALDSSDYSRLYAGTLGGVYARTIAKVPGDCDGDFGVSIGEVQRAINMFVWGTTPACGVDEDGNGDVTIGEVQKVINVFLESSSPCP